MKKALIFLGGDKVTGLALNSLTRLLAEDVLLIAADSGAEHLLALNRYPDFLIGDCDSIAKDALDTCLSQGTQLVRLPTAKDMTDGEAALALAIEYNAQDLHIFGAMGGKIDHGLGNLFLPLHYREKWQNICFYDQFSYAYYSFGNSKIAGTVGDTVSFIPLSAQVSNIHLSGFCYGLAGRDIRMGDSLCLRNQLAEPIGQIRFEQGIMLVVHTPGDVYEN